MHKCSLISKDNHAMFSSGQRHIYATVICQKTEFFSFVIPYAWKYYYFLFRALETVNCIHFALHIKFF